MKYTIISVCGNETTGECGKGGLGLEAAQKVVGGYIELVSVLHEGKACHMIANEMGALYMWGHNKNQQLDINRKATEIYHAASRARGQDWNGAPYIHGNVILYEGRLA